MDRTERIRLMEIAVAAGVEPWNVIAYCQQLEKYAEGSAKAQEMVEDPPHIEIPSVSNKPRAN